MKGGRRAAWGPLLLATLALILIAASFAVLNSMTIMGYLVDSCTASGYRAAPRPSCIDCPIHECEAMIWRAINVAMFLALACAALAAGIRARQSRRAALAVKGRLGA